MGLILKSMFISAVFTLAADVAITGWNGSVAQDIYFWVRTHKVY